MSQQDDPRPEDLDPQDAPEGAVEAGDEDEPDALPGEPGYVAKRLQRVKRQRDEAQRLASEREGELRATNARLAALEARISAQPQQGEKAKPSIDDELKMARDFLGKVEANRLIIDTSDDDDLIKQAKGQLSGLRADDIAFAHSELARLQGLKAAQEEGRNISTRFDGQSAQAAFKERLKLEFGPDAVNSKSDLFQQAAKEYRDLIETFPDDSGGAVTWMALERARNKQSQTRAGRGSPLDRRRLEIEATTRREGQLANTISALEARGDQSSRAKANELKVDAFLQHHFGGR